MKCLGTTFEIAARYEMDSFVKTFSANMSGLQNIYTTGNELVFPIASLNGIQPVNATTLLAPSVVKTTIANFSQLSNYFDATQGESLYVSGGILKQYDGDNIVEAGFLDTPPPIASIVPEISEHGAKGLGGRN